MLEFDLSVPPTRSIFWKPELISHISMIKNKIFEQCHDPVEVSVNRKDPSAVKGNYIETGTTLNESNLSGF